MARMADQIVIKQIKQYLSAESLGIEIASLEVIPEVEEVKVSRASSRDQEGGVVDEKSDMEDFVRQEIAGPGLNFSNQSISSTKPLHLSQERIKHTSGKLIRDTKGILSDSDSSVLRLNSKPLSRVVSVQEDWLRVNFSLFKLGEVLYQRYFAKNVRVPI